LKDKPLILILLGSFLVSEAARKALWACLVDEPTLLIRFFFEKLSHKERRVNIDIFFCKLISIIFSILDQISSKSSSFDDLSN
jgi:hypothetical protein